jgi:hypothetical protein
LNGTQPGGGAGSPAFHAGASWESRNATGPQSCATYYWSHSRR